jgi:hypothetical protein
MTKITKLLEFCCLLAPLLVFFTNKKYNYKLFNIEY